MSAEAMKAARKLSAETWDHIEAVRLAVPEKRRPSHALIQLVLREVAWCYVDALGYADPTLAQIASTLYQFSERSIAAALKALQDAGIVPVLRNATRGLYGQPGRAPRRGLSFYAPLPHVTIRKVVTTPAASGVTSLSLQELRAEVESLHELSRTGETARKRQQALLKWQDKREELRRRENV
jgi:hypothetical protein